MGYLPSFSHLVYSSLHLRAEEQDHGDTVQVNKLKFSDFVNLQKLVHTGANFFPSFTILWFRIQGG